MANNTSNHTVLKRNSSFLKFSGIMILLIIICPQSCAQVSLGTSPYIQNFNTTTLPDGWTTRLSATSTSAGTNVTPITANTWADASGEFRFVASAKTPLTSGSSTALQNASTDRCLAVKSTASFGDPGQAFTFQIANTIGLTNFNLTFNAQLLDPNSRTTAYIVEYGLGANPTTWTQVGTTFTDLGINSGMWGTTDITKSFGNLLDNQSTNVWIRISSSTASTGSGSRCTFGIDDVNLSWSTATSNPVSFSASPASATQINLSVIANANSDNIIVVSNSTGSFSTPTNGVASGNTGDSFAGGTIIYKGPATSITNHSGLTANTTYYYKAFSYDSSNNYSSGLTANATSAKIEPTNQPTGIRISTIITSTIIPLTWTAATPGSQAADGYLVKLSAGTISEPVDGTDPGAGSSTISSGTATYKATTGTTFTDATPGAMYNVKVYSFTNSGDMIDFNTNSPATFYVATPPDPVSSGSLTATGATSANINWTAANQYSNANHSTLVFVKATNPITTDTPTNAPASYTASTVFGSGTAYQNDASATCVYNGDGTNVSVTGLYANTTYHVLIYTVVDAPNSNSKNAYSSSIITSGTTSNLPAPTTNTASFISAAGFTANWNHIEGATSYKLDVSTLPIFNSAGPSTLNEGFDGGTTTPANWTFTNIGETYTTVINSGINTPSLQMNGTNDGILTPTMNGAATQLSFWIKGQGTDAASALLVEGYNGSVWVTIKNITNSIPTTGTTYTFNSGSTPALPTDIIQFRFSYTKSAGNISFDDVSINYNVISPSIIDSYNNLDAGNTTSQPVTGLSPNTTYYYRVRATNSNSTSASSNIIAATTSNTFSINSTVNASTLPVCSTCDVSVSSGVLLNIDESKTYNAITVEPGGKLTNAAGSTLTTTTLNLKSSALGTATYLDNGATDIETTHVEQYLTSGRNWYVSSPITAANTNALSTATSIVYWDETIGNWATPGATLNPLIGYISVSTNDSRAITFSGTLNNGEKTIGLTRTPGKTKEGFNLVGNPYPSYLNWTSTIATAANALTTIWYRTRVAGIYEFHTYNATGGIGIPAGVTNEIPPMQAFWVRVNAGGGTLTFNNSMRSHGSASNPLKVKTSSSTQQKILRLQVSNATNSDETVVYFNPDASDSYDAFDSPKMTNGNAATPEIFTLAGTEEVAINGLSTLSIDKELPIGFSTKETNSFTIKASEIRNFNLETKVMLKDKFLNTEQELTNATSYIFTSNPITTTSRFSLIFRSPSTVTDINKSTNDQDIDIYKNANNQLVIHCYGNIRSSLRVYNSTGQLLISKQLANYNTVIKIPAHSGILIVTVVSGEKNMTKKIVFE